MARSGSWTCRRSWRTSCAGRWTTAGTHAPARVDGDRPSCKGDDRTRPGYLFLGPRGGHPRRSNYADDFLTPAAEGLHPVRNGERRPVYVTAEPWPGIPIRRGNRRNKAADLADGTWPNLVGKFKPHDYRHSHATWLDVAGVSKVIQMDRRGHAMQGMDRVYMHVTPEMRAAPLRRPRGPLARRASRAVQDQRSFIRRTP